jgi:hypothetical protein
MTATLQARDQMKDSTRRQCGCDLNYVQEERSGCFFASPLRSLWVKSGQTIAGQNPPLSAVTPIADKRGCGCDVRYVPEADSCTATKSGRFNGANILS